MFGGSELSEGYAEDAAFGRNAPNSYILPQETPQNKQVNSDSWKYLQATLSENGRWTPVPQKEPTLQKQHLQKSRDTFIPPQQLTVATAATDPTPPETNNNRRVLHDGCCVITMKS